VRLVWASLWLPAPRAYRAHAGVAEDDLAMSVVIMKLVDAERAGVVFTVDPAGSASDLRIEAVEGLGEQLVSGEVTPDAYVLPRLATDRPSVDPVLDEAVEAALDLERRFGDPQDVEWAHDGDRLYIVQSRPITTIAPDYRARDERRWIRYSNWSGRFLHDGGNCRVAPWCPASTSVDNGRTAA